MSSGPKETALAATVPQALGLRLVAGNASRAIGRLLSGDGMGPGDATALREAAARLREGSSATQVHGPVATAQRLNGLMAAAVEAFETKDGTRHPVIEGRSASPADKVASDLATLADDLDAIAERRADEEFLQSVDQQLMLLRRALARSHRSRATSEIIVRSPSE